MDKKRRRSKRSCRVQQMTEFEQRQKVLRKKSSQMEIIPSFKNLNSSVDEEEKINNPLLQNVLASQLPDELQILYKIPSNHQQPQSDNAQNLTDALQENHQPQQENHQPQQRNNSLAMSVELPAINPIIPIQQVPYSNQQFAPISQQIQINLPDMFLNPLLNDQQPVEEQKNEEQVVQEPEEQKENVVNVSSRQFFQKVPNRDVLRDFFQNKCQRYAPPKRELTLEFCKDILAGKKKLLKVQDVKWITEVPHFKELSSKAIWNELKKDEAVQVYFSKYSLSRTPQKQYLLNVVNTIKPNCIPTIVERLKRQRQQEEVEQAPIQLTEEFKAFFEDFQTLSVNTRQYGLGRLITPTLSSCPICFTVVRSKLTQRDFKCKRHQGHKRCVTRYYESELAKRSRFLCPFRCSEVEIR